MQSMEQQKHKTFPTINMGVMVIFILVTILFLLALRTSTYSKAVFYNSPGQGITKTMTSR